MTTTDWLLAVAAALVLFWAAAAIGLALAWWLFRGGGFRNRRSSLGDRWASTKPFSQNSRKIFVCKMRRK